MSIKIRRLKEEDSRDDFSCGELHIDNFFKKFAGQNQFRHYIGTTYVLLLDDKIVGFVTVSSGSIRVEELNKKMRKLPRYPLPILRVTRVGVDIRYQGRGFAKELLKFALKLSIEQKKRFGRIGVIVDAKEESVSFYEEFGFESIEVVSGQLDVRPYPKMMFLSMDTILEAIG